MTNKIKIGDIAPDFQFSLDGKNQFLSECLGKFVIVYFYPKDDTPGCTIEAKGFNELKQDFLDLNTIIIGISKDDENSHNKFKQKYNLAFPLVADITTKIADSYGVYVEKSMFGKKYMGIDRVTFLIDKDGKIANIWQKFSVLNHANQLLKYIKNNQT